MNIDNLKQQAKNKLANLTTIESGGLIVLSILILWLVFYRLTWLPLNQWKEASELQFQQKEQQLEWVKRTIPLIQGVSLSPSVSSDLPLLSIIETTLQSNSNISGQLTELSQASQGRVRLQFNNVPFSFLMKWILEIKQEQGINVYTLTLTPGDSAGTTQAAMILEK